MPDYDRDPEALAWARTKVQFHIDKARRWSDQSAGWRRIANHMQRSFVGGEGCVIAAFDERHPLYADLADRPADTGQETPDA